MARRDFGSMLASIDTASEETPPDAKNTSAEAETPPATSQSASSRVPAGQGYKDLERKEIRLRGEQFDSLTSLQRELNRRRQGRGRRITENTLIRLGIDLLLERAQFLEGADEAELARSLDLQ